MQRIIEELSEAVGFGAAIEIARRWGGRQLNVPHTVGATDALALALGLETARKLVAAFRGTSITLPVERNALLDLRNQAIRARRVAGASHEAIGVEFGLTRQAIAHVLHRTGGDPRPAQPQEFAG
jgi:Mor family transcriptional regulator